MHPQQKLPSTILNLPILFYSKDYKKIYMNGETVTVDIPSKEWTLKIGYNLGKNMYTVGVNDVEMKNIPESPKSVLS